MTTRRDFLHTFGLLGGAAAASTATDLAPQWPLQTPERHGLLTFWWAGQWGVPTAQHVWTVGSGCAGILPWQTECGWGTTTMNDRWWATQPDGRPSFGECPKCRAAVERAKAGRLA